MLRAVFSNNCRAKIPQAARLLKAMDTYERPSRPVVYVLPRYLATDADDGVKPPTGIISGGRVTSTTSAEPIADSTRAGGDASSCAQSHMQPITLNDDKVSKAEKKVKSGAARSSESEKGLKNTKNNDGSTSSSLGDEAVKHFQEVSARLPSRDQVEKFIFRVVALFYDIIYLTGTWTIYVFNEKVLKNPTFQYYWKRFHDKMEAAKKD